MAGVKGKSGRKAISLEMKEKMNIAQIGMRLLYDVIHDPNKTADQKLDRLQPFLLKMMPEKLQVEDQNQLHLTSEEKIKRAVMIFPKLLNG